MATSRTGNRRRAFTLLELIMVMVVICTVLAIAAPNMRGFWAGMRHRDSANEVCALTQYARSQAISDGTTYRLNIDPNGKQFSLTMLDPSSSTANAQNAFVPVTTSLGQNFQTADGVQVSLTRDDGAPGDHVDFFPDGRTEPATMHVTQGEKYDIQIVCLSPTERFRIVRPGEQP
jgi:type II secretion system protein H